jgi:hypothetical protein
MITNLKKIWLLTVLIFILISCQKDNSEQVPSVYVHLELGTFTDLSNLGPGTMATIIRDTTSASINSSIIEFHNSKFPNIRLNQRIDGNGILLYRVDVDHFFAFDLTCPYRARIDYCAIDIDKPFPTCPCCNSKFLFSVQDGEFIPSTDSKASTSLKKYQAILTYNGTTLLITN